MIRNKDLVWTVVVMGGRLGLEVEVTGASTSVNRSGLGDGDRCL